MLTQIHVRNLATIEELDLHLPNACTMITGETGAGKSIFIEAIELALGGRASPSMIRTGKDKLEISLAFDVTHFPKVVELLQSHDLHLDAPECIIRRVITSDGRSRSYVNGAPTTLQLSKELGDILFHLHGQHEQQVLLRADTQRDILDRYADLLPLAAKVKNLAENWRSHHAHLLAMRAQMLEQQSRSDYLQFQLQEFENINLKEHEWPELEKEHRRLMHAEELTHELQQALTQISGDDSTALVANFAELRKHMESMTRYLPQANAWTNTIHSIFIQLADLECELKDCLEKCELDPEKLQVIESRVSQVFNLSRKYKVTPNELPALHKNIAAEYAAMTNTDQDIQDLIALLNKIEADYKIHAQTLSEKRQQAALMLEQEITSTMRSLSLPHGEFKISFELEKEAYSPQGNEKTIFLIKTNPDQHLQPITKAISGGELSRLSLAAHLSLAEKTSIPTLVFDEVDTGLSGAAAEKIGKLLKKLGESFQVFCVTHQPQVAALGHNHLLVEKCIIDKRTHTTLRLLDNEKKTREIARMLGGVTITQKTLEHAEELLQGS